MVHDSARVSSLAVAPAPAAARRDMVFRLDFYVGERDLLGVGFSDNVIFRKQYYLRAAVPADRGLAESLDEAELSLYTGEDFEDDAQGTPLTLANGRWSFTISGTGFEADLGVELHHVAEADVVRV